MKNIDIEQLERKNIYTVPENFFETVQQNVLKKTVQQNNPAEIAKPEAKIIPLKTNWIYAAAASLAILLGVGFFIKNTNAAPENNPQVAVNNTDRQFVAAQEQTSVSNEIVAAADSENETANINDDLTFESNNHQNINKVSKPVKSIAANNALAKPTANRAANINKEESVDQILTSFTSSELAEMSKDAEMDVYLDLYN